MRIAIMATLEPIVKTELNENQDSLEALWITGTPSVPSHK